jgi:transposase-like protein
LLSICETGIAARPYSQTPRGRKRPGTPKPPLKRAKRWAARWQDREPEAVRLFMEGLDKTFVYYRFDPYVWRKIRTTNVVARYFREVRRRLKNISAYRNEQSIDRMAFATINGIVARGYPYKHRNLLHTTPDAIYVGRTLAITIQVYIMIVSCSST